MHGGLTLLLVAKLPTINIPAKQVQIVTALLFHLICTCYASTGRKESVLRNIPVVEYHVSDTAFFFFWSGGKNPHNQEHAEVLLAFMN